MLPTMFLSSLGGANGPTLEIPADIFCVGGIGLMLFTLLLVKVTAWRERNDVFKELTRRDQPVIVHEGTSAGTVILIVMLMVIAVMLYVLGFGTV